MILEPDGGRVAVSNRQRRWKINSKRLAAIATQALALVGDTGAQVSLVLVEDAAIAKVNEKFHHTPGPTDVLSFDYGEGQGELVISVERAVMQARRFHSTPSRELLLYVVHGVLHLHGYNDLTALDRRRMHAAQRRLLTNLGKKLKRPLVVVGRRPKHLSPKQIGA